MSDKFFRVKESPETWRNTKGEQNAVVSRLPWEKATFSLGGLSIKSRKAWGAAEPIWRNEVIYYNTEVSGLSAILTKIVVHHTNNSDSISANESKQQGKGYAALGYHFFIATDGQIYEGRPIEIMGSHAGAGLKTGPLSDPDWGAIGIVLQGDYHHKDDWFWSDDATREQLDKLEKLISALKKKYAISKLLMHREIQGRAGEETVCPGDHLVPHVTAIRNKLKLNAK